MNKNELINAITNIYAMKLVQWTMEGKFDWVKYCQEFVNKIEYISKYDDRKTISHICLNNNSDHEAVRWCIGYASTIENIKCKFATCNFNFNKDNHINNIIAITKL